LYITATNQISKGITEANVAPRTGKDKISFYLGENFKITSKGRTNIKIIGPFIIRPKPNPSDHNTRPSRESNTCQRNKP